MSPAEHGSCEGGSMHTNLHRFHVPVMGTGFTIDTALRVARFGIDSVLSLADDRLIERVRKHYSGLHEIDFAPISRKEPDARARRITAYLDLVDTVVSRQMQELKALPFAPGNEKTRYFELLPASSPVRQHYDEMLTLPEGIGRRAAEHLLTEAMRPGSIDVNIMTKLDRTPSDAGGNPAAPEFTDAKAALRGFARSTGEGSVVFSAGINPSLFGYLEELPEFHHEGLRRPRKKVILKVSDFRSALVQGKFLAKKGIALYEIRIESGLNCGGHAFATDGLLLGPILQEFREKRSELESILGGPFRLTVQGGIGTCGETRRLIERFGVDATGWGSPFLLVPEVAALDGETRQKLADADEDDLYLSDVSPLGVPFNNLRGSTSEERTLERIASGKPGSGCPNSYLAFSTEFGKPLCTASAEFQKLKLAAMGIQTPPTIEGASPEVRALYQKACLCDHLGNGALIDLGIGDKELPVAVCPGPNIAYFNRIYTLEEMVDQIYGRGEGLVPATRPHMFAKELELNLDHFRRFASQADASDPKVRRRLESYRQTLTDGLAFYGRMLTEPAFPGENIESLRIAVDAACRELGESASSLAVGA
jgi:hypothetical protein